MSAQTQYVVPMYESERGWGSKIDGFAGPFDSYEAAKQFQTDYNREYNSAEEVPDWYISALDPREFEDHTCSYMTEVVGKE